MTRPSVSVVPWPDESIPSMIWRLQAVTGAVVGNPQITNTKLYDGPEPATVELLARRLGVEPEVLARHTLKGQLGSASRSLGVRDFRPSGRWACQRCGYQTIWSRLVLVTACPACRLLYGDATALRRPATSARASALELQAHYLNALTHRRLAQDTRIERFWRLVKFHLCTQWWWTDVPAPVPMPVGTGLGNPRDLRWRDPDWMAQFATVAWPASETLTTFREHIMRVTVAAILEDFPESPVVGEDDVARERWLLHREIRQTGLREQHVPDHLLGGRSPLGGCHLEAIGYAMSRALRREVVMAGGGGRWSKDQLIAGRGRLRQTKEIAAINQLVEHRGDGLRILRRLAAGLTQTATGDHVDYGERRATLAALHTVPATVLVQLSAPVRNRSMATTVERNPLARDAAAWLWIHLAGGVLHHSPHPAGMRGRLRAFDQALAPEDRLVLLEYGVDVLGAVADDVIRPHVAARPDAGACADVG